MRLLKGFITLVALGLLAVVGIGLALPGTWAAERSLVVEAPPAAVFGYLDSVEGWSAWAPLSAVDGVREGPQRGPGARLRWDDPEWGQGEWTLTSADAPHTVSYEVRVEDGALVTRGEVTLVPEGSGTRIEWRETGDFGWNPVLAYMALGMERLQGREMEKSLAALGARLAAPPPAP